VISQEYRRLIVVIKHTPRSNRIGTPDAGFEIETTRLGIGVEYVIPTPASVRRQAALADALIRELSVGQPPRKNVVARPYVLWITDATMRPRRPHRRTGKPHGRPRKPQNNTAQAAFAKSIAKAICQLVRMRGMKRSAARRLVAATLLDSAFKSTSEAVLKALEAKRATKGALSEQEWAAVESGRHRLRRLLIG
jgi:hypothetical protein